MMDYNHWAAFGFLGELLPNAANRVQLAEEKDRHGLPVAKITFSLFFCSRMIKGSSGF
jgi:hypothetical protein